MWLQFNQKYNNWCKFRRNRFSSLDDRAGHSKKTHFQGCEMSSSTDFIWIYDKIRYQVGKGLQIIYLSQNVR